MTLSDEELDPDAIETDAVEYLAEIVKSRPDGRQMGAGISAASKLIDWAEKRRSPERAFLALFGGDPAKALKWVSDNHARLLSAVAPAKELESKEEDQGDDVGKAE